jgi:hypothetical protein
MGGVRLALAGLIALTLLFACAYLWGQDADGGGFGSGGGSGIVNWNDESVKEFDLKFRCLSRFPYLTPNPAISRVRPGSGGRLSLPLPSKDGMGFVFQETRRGPYIDLNGDGKIDAPVKGVVTLATSYEDGASRYALVIKKNKDSWTYERRCVMAGKALGYPFVLIDDNNNGRYDEYGVDAMVVGRSKAAHCLSRMVNIKGKLYHFKTTASGKKVWLKPYDGAAGTLNLQKGFRVSGKLFWAIVQQGDNYFNMAGHKKGLRVPAGSYHFFGGRVGHNPNVSCRITRGGMSTLDVEKDKNLILKWGSPGKIKFTYTHTGGKLVIPPSVRYIGLAGEEYVDAKPADWAPKIQVRDQRGRIIHEAGMG